jgi:predicted TIM-barrel fold metal-dependent hydrolase
VNLKGGRVREVLEAHLRVAGDRLKGVRDGFAWANFPMFGRAPDPARQGILRDPAFRRSVAVLADMGLSYDGWGFHTQLGEFIDLARAVPQATLVLDHVGTPLLIGPDRADPKDVFARWTTDIRTLATCPNVVVKLGGLGMEFIGHPSYGRGAKATVDELLPVWRPYIEACIEAFGADRCMFESNFPVDAATCSYRTLWNVFKRITAGASLTEKSALFSGTATRVYRLAQS